MNNKQKLYVKIYSLHVYYIKLCLRDLLFLLRFLLFLSLPNKFGGLIVFAPFLIIIIIIILILILILLILWKRRIAPLMVTYHYVKCYVSIIMQLEVININVRNFKFPIGFYSNPHPQKLALTPFTLLILLLSFCAPWTCPQQISGTTGQNFMKLDGVIDICF
jgi:hypothetical protein